MNQSLLDDFEHQKLRKAGFGLRLRATLLDGILLLIAYSFFALFIFIASYALPIITFDIGVVFFSCTCFLYNPLMESSKSQGSLGKQVFNLKVVDKDGKRLSFGQALMRLIAKLLSFALFFAGFIMIGLSDKKEGLHDMIVKTSVIRTQKK
jgi:uncharacterized RDD family membrane protein YckC